MKPFRKLIAAAPKLFNLPHIFFGCLDSVIWSAGSEVRKRFSSPSVVIQVIWKQLIGFIFWKEGLYCLWSFRIVVWPNSGGCIMNSSFLVGFWFLPQTIQADLQFVKAQDHDGSVFEHFIYPCDTLLLLLAHILNIATHECFPTRWIEHTIVPIFKSGDPMTVSNYRTIMISHWLAKLSIICVWVERNECCPAGQQTFKRGS